ncbi:hypothetical protein [Ideonella sp. YS5]|uniref:hypothetical protein n=1 Tax=Ideonella sp. YS5 TaxID=3453714 RepID=UPI003EEF4339
MCRNAAQILAAPANPTAAQWKEAGQRLQQRRIADVHLANAFLKLQTDNRAALASRVQALVEMRRQTMGRTAVN